MSLFRSFPIDYQMDSQDCGPSCLKMIAKFYGKYYSLQYLRDKCGITKEGVSLLDLSTGAESIGLRTLSVRCTLVDLIEKVPFPTIVFWNENHFVVVYHATKKVSMSLTQQKAKLNTHMLSSQKDGYWMEKSWEFYLQ